MPPAKSLYGFLRKQVGKPKTPQSLDVTPAPSPPQTSISTCSSSTESASTQGSLTGAIPLERKAYYHGLLPREDAELVLKNTGDFLVRKTQHQNQDQYIISMRSTTNVIKHLLLRINSNGLYTANKEEFKSIEQLVESFQKNKKSLTEDGEGLLKHAVLKQKWMIDHSQIRLQRKLGEGAFGEVYKAVLTLSAERQMTVAVKRMRLGVLTSKENRRDFAREHRVMRKAVHDNLLRVYGMAVHEDPLMIVVEFCPHGALNDYLVKHANDVGWSQRICWCVEAAQGLRYLEKIGCIHRDVAARNCLLDFTMTVKIADFGMSVNQVAGGGGRKEGVNTHHEDDDNLRLPLKWLAPETLGRREFSTKTDVWSFGVLMWEVFADGADPYPGMLALEAAKCVKGGFRMEAPLKMGDAEAAWMLRCWADQPNLRPTFLKIKVALRKICKSGS